MAEPLRPGDLLSAESLARLDALGAVEVVVGVLVRDHAGSIGAVLSALAAGLRRHRDGRRGVLLVLDAGAQESTTDAVQRWLTAADDPAAAHWLRPAAGASAASRGRALLGLFAAALRLGAPACAFVDADLAGAAPDWIPALLDPVLEGKAAYVLPCYTRPLSEGTLTTNLLAPVTRALYGKRVHEVMGGCAGLAPSLAAPLLDAESWRADPLAAGLELLLTTEAVASGAPVAEAPLGRKQVAAGWGPSDLATTLVHTVGTLFGAMERFYARWDAVQGSVPLSPERGTLLPASAGVHLERMVHAFRIGLKDLLPVWEQIMSEETLAQLYPLGVLAPEEFRFAPPVWARAVSDFALAYRDRRLPREHLLRALTPLYLGRVAAFLVEARATTPSRSEMLLEAIGRAFEHEKEDLRFRWR
jgi:glucosylglycerate synthase